MSDNKLRRLPLAAAALLVCFGAQADYTSPDGDFRLSGFGTLGAVRSSTDDAGFNYPGQGKGTGKTVSLNADSKIAIQGTYNITPTVSATTQVMTKINADGDYVPNIEWIFAKWKVTPALTVRAGRIGAPFFMVSDFRDVGYANTTVRPNLDVYGQVPVSQFEGADISYQAHLGSVSLTSTLWSGVSRSDYALANPDERDPSKVKLSRSLGLNLVAETDMGLTFRFGHTQGKLDASSTTGSQLTALAQGLAGGLPDPFGAGAAQTASLLTVNKVDASFTGIGVSYDSGEWLLNTEFTKRKTDSYISDSTGWYVMVGRRISNFTPYVGVSRLKTDERASNPVVVPPNAGGFATPNPLLGGLSAFQASALLSGGVDGILNTQKIDQRTATLGVRWDAMSNLAVKAQWDHIRKPANAQGLFFDPSDSNFVAEKRKVNVVTLSVDFVF